MGGSSLPAVRVDLNPQALFNQGVSLDDVRSAISNANVSGPKGSLDGAQQSYTIAANDQIHSRLHRLIATAIR